MLTISKMGNPILYQRAQEVIDPCAAHIQTIVKNLIEACYATKGTGMAAPQLSELFRIIVFHASATRTAKHGYNKEIPFTVLINPIIEPLSEKIEMTWEGCLSLPGMMGEVPRYAHIRYQGLTPEGGWISREAEGLHAYVVQHEYDHLDGILYPMRMKNFSRFGFIDEFQGILAEEFLGEFR